MEYVLRAADICGVSFCWIFFRAENVANAMDVIRQMCSFSDGIRQPYAWMFFAMILLFATTWSFWHHSGKAAADIRVDYPVLNLKTVSGLTLFFVLCGLTIGMAYLGNTAFIYGAF